MQGQSFWSDGGSSENHGDEHAEDPITAARNLMRDENQRPALQWTSVFPSELLAAAAEEESYLASSSSAADSDEAQSAVAAPNIPPAPTLPRHLDKLILNAKREDPARVRGREERKRERAREKGGRSMLGMTAALTASGSGDGDDTGSDVIPVITPSGTHLPMPSTHASHPRNQRRPLEIMSDDASVLPVPSHVVLHHLSTSAIRNGVLAVGSTTRYRKKYLTTIYYKPT